MTGLFGAREAALKKKDKLPDILLWGNKSKKEYFQWNA